MIPGMDLERNWYREDDISTKIYASQNYEADFNSANNNVTYTQSPVTSSYIRVGKMIYISVKVDFSKITSLGTGRYYFTLPFEATRHQGVPSGMLHEGTANKIRVIFGKTEKESKKCELYYLDNQVEYADFDHQHPHNLNSDDYFHLEGWYEAEVQL